MGRSAKLMRVQQREKVKKLEKGKEWKKSALSNARKEFKKQKQLALEEEEAEKKSKKETLLRDEKGEIDEKNWLEKKLPAIHDLKSDSVKSNRFAHLLGDSLDAFTEKQGGAAYSKKKGKVGGAKKVKVKFR